MDDGITRTGDHLHCSLLSCHTRRRKDTHSCRGKERGGRGMASRAERVKGTLTRSWRYSWRTIPSCRIYWKRKMA